MMQFNIKVVREHDAEKFAQAVQALLNEGYKLERKMVRLAGENCGQRFSVEDRFDAVLIRETPVADSGATPGGPDSRGYLWEPPAAALAGEKPKPFTPALRQVLATALRVSRGLGDNYCGVKHVIMASFEVPASKEIWEEAFGDLSAATMEHWVRNKFSNCTEPHIPSGA